MNSSDQTFVLQLEERLAKFVRELAPPSSSVEPAWPMPKVQEVYAGAMRALGSYQSELEERSLGSADPFWRRRRSEVSRLGRELKAVVLARKTHTERAATFELLGQPLKSHKRAQSSGGGPSSAEAADEAKKIMESLQRTSRMMDGALGQASVARGAIEEDGRLLRGTFDQHKKIGSTVTKASRVLRKIQRQDEVDRWLMISVTVFFAFVVLWVTIPRVPGLTTVARLSAEIAGKVSSGAGMGTIEGPRDVGPSAFGDFNSTLMSTEIKADGVVVEYGSSYINDDDVRTTQDLEAAPSATIEVTSSAHSMGDKIAHQEVKNEEIFLAESKVEVIAGMPFSSGDLVLREEAAGEEFPEANLISHLDSESTPDSSGTSTDDDNVPRSDNKNKIAVEGAGEMISTHFDDEDENEEVRAKVGHEFSSDISQIFDTKIKSVGIESDGHEQQLFIMEETKVLFSNAEDQENEEQPEAVSAEDSLETQPPADKHELPAVEGVRLSPEPPEVTQTSDTGIESIVSSSFPSSPIFVRIKSAPSSTEVAKGATGRYRLAGEAFGSPYYFMKSGLHGGGSRYLYRSTVGRWSITTTAEKVRAFSFEINVHISAC